MSGFSRYCLCGSLTFKYVSPLTSYKNWHSVLFRMAMVDPLTWILKAGKAKQINENLVHLKSVIWPHLFPLDSGHSLLDSSDILVK